jgi:hypothetical protein
MPIATEIESTGEHFDLKTLPGGFVELRRMTHGEKMYRKSLMSNAKIATASTGNRAARRAGQRAPQQDTNIELELSNTRVTLYEFSVSIVNHNLTYLKVKDDPTSETLLDFKIREHVEMLAGRVGDEIDELITEINSIETDEDTGK